MRYDLNLGTIISQHLQDNSNEGHPLSNVRMEMKSILNVNVFTPK